MSDSGLLAGIERRIFVVGAPRSGTTLVQSLLAAHSALTSYTESHLFARHFTLLPFSTRAILTRDPTPRLREFLAENGEGPPESASGLAAEHRSLRRSRLLLPLQTRPVARQLLRLLDELTLRRGKPGWIEKTPRHLRYLDFLEWVAGAGSRLYFVHVIRRGTAVAASLHRASQSWERAYDLETCARRWNGDLRLSLRRLGAPSDRFVLYEELVSRPEEVLQRLLAALGLAWEPAILERYAATSRRLVTGREERWKGNVGGGIHQSATGDRTLTREQRQLLRRSLRRELYDRLRERLGQPATGREDADE